MTHARNAVVTRDRDDAPTQGALGDVKVSTDNARAAAANPKKPSREERIA